MVCLFCKTFCKKACNLKPFVRYWPQIELPIHLRRSRYDGHHPQQDLQSRPPQRKKTSRAFRQLPRCRVWENAKRMIEDAKYSDEVKEAAKMIKTTHHFEGRSRKVESKISWKLDQMLSTYADKQAAREYAEILERRDALDPRNFFSPRIPEGKFA